VSQRAGGRWARGDLTYCGNVHPGESLGAAAGHLRERFARVRERRGLAWMASGLWLAAPVAAELAGDASARAALAEALAGAGIRLYTLNGFPYGGFHDARVKQAVYRPDWADPRRLAYTLDLARVIAALLPAGTGEGTISTLPLGYRHEWSEARHEAALGALCRLASELARLADATGRRVRVCLEMEPGCVLERTGEALALFAERLPAAARARGTPAGALADHLGVCYDVCHQAVMFEEAGASLGRLHAAGVSIGKVQVSSALAVPDPATARQALAPFDEPRYLHQVRARLPGGAVEGPDDLPAALATPGLDRHPWRVHFHLPIQAETVAGGALATTRVEIGRVLDFLAAHPEVRPHLEVETYTWQVLPADLRPADDAALIERLTDELVWLEGELRGRGLLEE
jgi:sugar phosphate isomerase/epimerase